jgi:hypothetical protein
LRNASDLLQFLARQAALSGLGAGGFAVGQPAGARVDFQGDPLLPRGHYCRINRGALLRTDLKSRYESYELIGEAASIKRTGQEAILWANGSQQFIAAPTKEIGHSRSIDLAVLDEGWSHEDDTCEQGLSPTMITRGSPQLWIPSAVGQERSQWLRAKVEAGRERCENPDTTTAYFEFSATEGADYTDPAVWWDTLPGLGHVCTEDAIRHELESMEPAAFCRAYLSQWPDEMVALQWRTIREQDWKALRDERSQVIGRCALGVAVSQDRCWGSIAMAGASSCGGQHWQVLEHGPGTGYMLQRLGELVRQLQPCAVVIDPGGPAGSLGPGPDRRTDRLRADDRAGRVPGNRRRAGRGQDARAALLRGAVLGPGSGRGRRAAASPRRRPRLVPQHPHRTPGGLHAGRVGPHHPRSPRHRAGDPHRHRALGQLATSQACCPLR